MSSSATSVIAAKSTDEKPHSFWQPRHGRDVRGRETRPLGDPVEIKVRGYNFTLRKNEAEQILVRVKA